MKKLFFIHLIFLTGLTNSYSQNTWFSQNPMPTGENINSVDFINPNSGFAVANGGEIHFTENGGIDWSSKLSSTSKNLNDVYFQNSGTGFIAGDSGLVMRTINGGTNWKVLVTGVTENLLSIWCINEQVVIASGQGGAIIKTTDGGSNWIRMNSGTTNLLRDISFVNDQTGIIVGDGGICIKTTDAGLSWSSRTIGSGTHYAVAFTNITTGLAITGTTIKRTFDGGDTWTTINSGVNYYLYDVMYLDSLTSIVVGTGTIGGTTKIMRSTNRGDNWSNVIGSFTYSTLFGICKTESNTVIAVGNVVTKSTNAGVSWLSLSKRYTSEDLRDVSFSDALNGNIVGHNVLLRTTNGGSSWFNQIIPGGINDSWLNAVDMVNSNVGALVGGLDFIYRTTNGGLNWIPQYRDNDYQLYDIQFINEDYGVACGGRETIMRTTNGGINWITQRRDVTNYSLMSIFFSDVNTGVAVGAGATASNILRTTNGGNNWVQQVSGVNIYLNSVFLINSMTGYIAGGEPGSSGQAALLKTTNGGMNWNVNLSSNGDFSSVFFVNESVGYVLSKYSRIIFQTTNGGESWIPYSMGTTKYPASMHFYDSNTGWMVANTGTIRKTTNSGIILSSQFSGSEVSNDFLLDQNFPNPFNPETIIKYEIPATGFVSLSVYNSLGKCVAELINEVQFSGSHEVRFDGSELSAGVYFYRLTVNDFSYVKKMLLIK